MSRFSGRQGKGALQRHRDDIYRAAVGRQLLLIDQGSEARNSRGQLIYPAPAEEFLRRGDELSRTDFRSYAAEVVTQTAKGTPHRYQDDPETPDTCRVCHRIKANGAHDPAAVAEAEAAIAAAHAEYRRRYGTD